MMLKEKIGQMLVIGFKGMALHADDAIVQAILDQQIGGVILFDYDVQTNQFDRNIKNADQLKQLTEQLQSYTKQVTQHPLLISIDYEGGRVNRLKEQYGFPRTLSAADIGLSCWEQVNQQAQQMAYTLKQVGINMNFAPVVDVNVNPESPAVGRLGRSFSSDPLKVIDYASIVSAAHYYQGIQCAYKHFPGHGSSTNDTHGGLVDITQTWRECELDPYKKLLRLPYGSSVITAHVTHYGLDRQGYPASLSAAITQGLLREKLGFNGVVVTDDMQMKAITDYYSLEESVRLAIHAGADLLVFGNQLVSTLQDPKQIVDLIYADVLSGRISENKINESYRRIMALKSSMSRSQIID